MLGSEGTLDPEDRDALRGAGAADEVRGTIAHRGLQARSIGLRASARSARGTPRRAAARPSVPRTSELANACRDDLLADLELCVERLAGLGIEVVVVDATRPDVGMPVVRVFAPGLRHFYRELAPGRLYDVPVRLGWIAQRPDEDDLNPFDLIF